MDPNDAAGLGSAVGFGMLQTLLLYLVPLYVYLGIVISVIARKLNAPNTTMAWIPIGQIVLLTQLARKPSWWTIMLILPCINLIFIALVWSTIAEELGQPSAIGILAAV